MATIDSESAASLILDHAQVITMDRERPYAKMVAIKGNKILAVGYRDEIARFKGTYTRVIDC